jgi:3-dehydroquinate synthase
MLEVKSHRGTYSVNFTEVENADIPNGSVAVVDEKVYQIYKDRFLDKFESCCIIEAKEENKNLRYCVEIINTLLTMESPAKKNTTLVAIGGGITQDITSFIASILYRGIDWCFIPTTLLAQADSCIGSKTSINFTGVKNVLGSFYPPKKIWCDSRFLKTLSRDDIDSGIGEMLHYFMLDHSNYLDSDFSLDSMDSLIRESLRIKKNMVEVDEFDQKERRVFNYGHTFGHAIEAVSDYKVSHGLAVTRGMHLANYISHKLGNIDKDTLDGLQNFIEFNLPNYLVEDVDAYVSKLMKDKKNTNSDLVCILPYGVADYRVTTISDIEELRTIIQCYFDECKQEQ